MEASEVATAVVETSAQGGIGFDQPEDAVATEFDVPAVSEIRQLSPPPAEVLAGLPRDHAA